VRDGDDTQKKKWFSRKKKPSLSPSTVSRPPSTASFGSSKRKPSSLGKSLDDDLPARESIGTPPLQDTNLPSTPDGQSRSTTPDIPVHAGFDLKAIKDMIGESEKNPEELQVPRPSRIHSSPVISQLDSAPPVSESSVTRAVPAREPTELPVTPRGNLSATFATSLSLHSGPDEGDDNQGTLAAANYFGSRDDLAYASSTLNVSTVPQISLGGNEGSMWSPPSLEKRAEFVNPFATNTVSFSNPNGTIRGSSFSHDLQHTYSPESGSSPSLSFGGVDGTITLQDMGQDPWKITAGDSKKTPNYLSNPW
jgi:hypothetical protein